MCGCTRTSCAEGMEGMEEEEEELKLHTSSAKEERACNGAPRGLQCKVWWSLDWLSIMQTSLVAKCNH
jgi:hypothetical protein